MRANGLDTMFYFITLKDYDMCILLKPWIQYYEDLRSVVGIVVDDDMHERRTMNGLKIVSDSKSHNNDELC